MGKLSTVINELYQKYQPLASAAKIKLNLDIRSDETVDDEKALSADLEKQLDSALKRAPQGQIKISVQDKKVTISDNGTILSKPICELLSSDRVQVKSRVGFGTKVSINLNKSKTTK